MRKILVVAGLILALAQPAYTQSFGNKKSTRAKISRSYTTPRKSKSSGSNYSNSRRGSAGKKDGIISQVKKAATRGFGWELGKEAAKETVKGVKNIIKNRKENAGGK